MNTSSPPQPPTTDPRTVGDVMTAPAQSAAPSDSVAVAAAHMNRDVVSSLVVVDGGRAVGIITERDVLRAAGAGADLSTAPVSDWMTPDPDCLDPDASIDAAWQQFAERHYRHLPVVVDGRLLGVVSLRDLTALAHLHPADEAHVAPAELKGMIVAETGLGDVRGQEGFYHYRQYSAPELAERRSFEDVWHLLIDGALPDAGTRERFAAEVAPYRRLPDEVLGVLPAISRSAGSVSSALRTALSHHASVLSLPNSMDVDHAARRTQALQLSAVVPSLIAAIHRLRNGLEPVASRSDLSYAADYLHMLRGEPASPEHVRAIEQYLILGIDHGFNASTFTTRVVTSTGSDLGSAVVAGAGALLGPLHGGAPSRALDTLDEIGTPDRAADWVREKVENGERIMGFGHPVYRTADPRSLMLRSIAQGLGGELVDFAVQVEAEVERTLAELKPGRALHTNVEWYAAVVMDRCGLDRSLFTPTFTASRVVGWCAQALEQAADNRIIRPSSRYVGPPPPQPVPEV